jgi:predicted component of type VI protein secretion system
MTAARRKFERSATITLRLFRQADPSFQIDERRLDDGELIIGRGRDADWPLDDPDCLLSRRHCSISFADGVATLTDLSANGVFLSSRAARAAAGETVGLTVGETLRLGDYMIVLDDAESAAPPAPTARQADAPFLVTTEATAPLQSTPAKDFDWPAEPQSTAANPPGGLAEDPGGLLEAFCAGAHLDVSAFAGEDPAVLMERLGAVYRQMVVGLAEVMSERTAVKAEYMMEHTTVRPSGNNPFRWASPQRIAIDLLREGHDGFLSGPAAVQASFGDVKRHLLCIFAGLRSALAATMDALSPETIEARIPARRILLKGHWAAAWQEYAMAHQHCRQGADEDADGLVNRGFRSGYARRLQELDGVGR